MAGVILKIFQGLLALLVSAQIVHSASRRKTKDEDKPKEPPQHLSLSFEELKSRMPAFSYKDFAEVATGHRRIFTLFISNKDPEGLRAFRGFYGAWQRLSQKELNVTWGYVDCDEDQPMCKFQDIHFTPQYYLYINKRRVNYTAGRSPYLLSDWLHKTIAYPGIFIDRRSQLKKYEDTQDRFFFYIGYMDQDYEFFKEIAASYPYYTWISCFDRDRLMHANGIYWYEQREKAQDMRNGPHGDIVMLNFTMKYFNLIRSMSDWLLERIFIHDRAAIFLFYPDTNEERGIQMPFWTAAMDLKWQILVVQLGMHDPEENKGTVHIMEMLGVTNVHSSAIRLLTLRDGRWLVYQLRDRINAHTVLQFYGQFKRNEIKPFYRSEKPVEHKSNEVRKIVGKNFNKYVHNPAHDFVIIYHTPNCTLCETVLKIGKIAVHVLARYEDIRIGELNTWLNDGEEVPQMFYPQIVLYKKGDKKHPVRYEGLYMARDVIAWITAQTSRDNPFEEEMGDRLRERREERAKGQDI